MNAAGRKSEAFDLCRSGEMVVIAKRKENVVDGIVTGIIANLLVFPLLSGTLILGIWMFVVSLTGGNGFHFAPQFDHFASPGVVRAAEVALPALMGIMFAGGSVFLLRLFLKSQASFFPYECRLKKDTDGGWIVRQRLWFLSFRWRKLGHNWVIWCYPNYSRGDWGYAFFIRSGKAMLRLASSGVFTNSRNQAEAEALEDLAELKALFEVSGEMKRWK